ncbi:MAG: hypothetical protein NZT92_13380, partial [Abditibacteriales bacterium]|nr:hypothetical protein [Abditibacteriales bacterium]MDW8366952.1 hypothetical protein [Abditibacteriales bacterium]
MTRRNLFRTCFVVAIVEIGLLHALAPPRWSPPGQRYFVSAWTGYDESGAREKFLREHPNEKPLNWAIGKVAMEFYKSRPMGKFVLHQNDCSDFVECIIDEALGVQARFKRGSDV